MNKGLKCFLIWALTLGLVSCSTTRNETDESSGVVAKNVDVETFSSLVQKNNGTVLDVRTSEEVASGRIESAENINFFANDFKQQIEKLDKTMPVYVYCASGGRSGKAMKMLTKAGFPEVYNLKGGMGAWKSKGYAVK